ncbi:Retrovirus-related Pol polyprotein from transposon TNT 1-94 [Nymphaea thermarum]|nr:Retrovirus-related Pol polyprotein from transposon TNT 1-94 [Nymphaea thermarum]
MRGVLLQDGRGMGCLVHGGALTLRRSDGTSSARVPNRNPARISSLLYQRFLHFAFEKMRLHAELSPLQLQVRFLLSSSSSLYSWALTTNGTGFWVGEDNETLNCQDVRQPPSWLVDELTSQRPASMSLQMGKLNLLDIHSGTPHQWNRLVHLLPSVLFPTPVNLIIAHWPFSLYIEVLDFAAFPEPEFDLPIFCANFFTAADRNIVVLLYGHVDGTIPAPPKYIIREVSKTVVGDETAGVSAGSEVRIEFETLTKNNPEYELWLAHDQSLVAYITSTLSEEVLGSIDEDLTALELWTTLATTYSQVSEARFLQLRRQFQDIKRGTRTVLEYLSEIKNVSDQLAAIGHPVSDKDKVQQALSGLGTEFDIFCTALEVLPILPSFEDLKAKLFQHEASRVQRQNLIPCNSHNVLITGTHALQGNRTRPWTSQTGMGRGILPTPLGMNATSATSRRVPTCFYCNKKGHVKSECWHNPQNKHNQVRRENKTAARSVSSSSGSNPTSNVSANVQQLLITYVTMVRENEQGEWYVDSGAAAHVTGDTDQGSVVTGDGSHHTISHVGNAQISMGSSSIPLKNVLVVPSVKKNIISVSKLIDDTHSSVEFTSSSVYVKDARTKKTFAEGTRKGNIQGAEMLTEHKVQDVNEPETVVSSSLNSTTSLDSMPSSSQPNDPPVHNRFSGLKQVGTLLDVTFMPGGVGRIPLPIPV